jgi:hypothetical protein
MPSEKGKNMIYDLVQHLALIMDRYMACRSGEMSPEADKGGYATTMGTAWTRIYRSDMIGRVRP